ncbi:MAG: hypothetical protein ABMA64_19840 [Myxococcota bacterium]
MSEWRAKHLVAVVAALVLGLVIGGFGPRREVRQLRRDVQVAERGGRRDVGKQLFGEVLQPRVTAADPPNQDEPTELPPDAADGPEPAPRSDRRSTRGSGPDPQSLEQMKQALDLRQAQARAALLEQAEPTDEQLAQIDSIFADMNHELHGLAEELVAIGTPERREMMVFGADALDVLIDAEESLRGVLEPDQLAELADEALDPTAYVDGTVVDVMAQLDGR